MYESVSQADGGRPCHTKGPAVYCIEILVICRKECPVPGLGTAPVSGCVVSCRMSVE